MVSDEYDEQYMMDTESDYRDKVFPVVFVENSITERCWQDSHHHSIPAGYRGHPRNRKLLGNLNTV